MVLSSTVYDAKTTKLTISTLKYQKLKFRIAVKNINRSIASNLLVDERKLFSSSLAFVNPKILASKHLFGIKRLFCNF